MTRRVLLDTSALYALAVQSDHGHTTAKAFLKQWLKQNGTFVLCDWVFIEAMTLLKRRAGSAVAVKVGQEMRRNPVNVWHPVTTELERETWALFQRYTDKEWSYTDCGLLVLARRLKVSDVFTLDDHFDQMPGVTRLPR